MGLSSRVEMPWDKAHLRDLITDQLIALKSSYNISWLQGHLIKRMMQKETITRVVWIQARISYSVYNGRELEMMQSQTEFENQKETIPSVQAQEISELQTVHFVRSQVHKSVRRPFADRLYPIVQIE
jgi:hypothetical protein